MPSKIRRRADFIKLTVNGVPHHSNSDRHEVKTRYGRQAVLLRPAAAQPESDATSAPAASPPTTTTATTTTATLTAAMVSEQLRGWTICAVDAHGRFLVEDCGDYTVGALRSEEEHGGIVEGYRKEVAEKRARRQRKPRKPTMAPRAVSTYLRFLGAFVVTFRDVALAEARAEWKQMTKEEKGRNVDVLIELMKSKKKYVLRAEPESDTPA